MPPAHWIRVVSSTSTYAKFIDNTKVSKELSMKDIKAHYTGMLPEVGAVFVYEDKIIEDDQLLCKVSASPPSTMLQGSGS